MKSRKKQEFDVEPSGKKICFAAPTHLSDTLGGGELQLYLLAEEFVNKGWEVSYISARRKIIDASHFNPGIQYFYYKPCRFKIIEVLNMLRCIKKTDAHFYYQRIDDFITGIVAFHCKKSKDRKFVYACAHDLNCQKWRKTRTMWQWKVSIFNRLAWIFNVGILTDILTLYGKKNADYRLVQSKKQQWLMKEHLNLDCTIVKNGFPMTQIKDSSKENIILWTASLRGVKRPEVFIKLVQESKLKDWKFVMIGKCLEKEYQNITKNVSNPNFMYLGEQPLSEVNKWFRRAKIFINTSKSEGFPNTFLQAWTNHTLLISLFFDPDNILKNKNLGIVTENYENLKNKLQDIDLLIEENSDKIINGLNYINENHDIKEKADYISKLLLKEKYYAHRKITIT